MPDQTDAQKVIVDERQATVLQEPSEESPNILVRDGEGQLFEIDPEGDILETDRTPPPIEEVIDAEAEELPPVDGTEDATAEEIEAAKPTAIELAVDPADPHSVYRVMDRADELLILEELQGRALQTFVYSFTSGGKRQTDLTVAGVNECVRLMNERGGTQIGISNNAPVVEHEQRAGEEYVRVLVFARDGRLPGSGRWGTAVEPVNHQDDKRKGKWDKFAFTKALNKAQRNALKMQIPEDFRQTIIAQYLGTVHHQQLKSIDQLKIAGGGTAELPSGPVLDDERAELLREEINDRYRRLRELNALKLPPALKTQRLKQAEADGHERMEAFRDTIDDWIREEGERLAEQGPKS